MRENRWMPRKLATPDGPRTIQQVREDAARDGCIYLPQQDNVLKPGGGSVPPSHHQEVLFSKSRNRGMEDIFGGPGGPATLGTGPGVIGGAGEEGYYDYRNGGGGPGPSFEEKFNANNAVYRDESRDHRDFKPKRDGFENKFAERPDFGDRFTANRNKTHPSNRGGGGGGGRGGLGRSNGYEKNGVGAHNGGENKDLPPRFKKMGGFGGGDNIPLRPSAASMMLKPRTPSSLPKSAMARLEGAAGLAAAGGPKLMMTTGEPAVFISKQSGDKKRNQEKRNQGPTREEVFGRIEEILKKLADSGSTNEAFTAWKEAEFPGKMVNNALIHLFKQVVKMPEAKDRSLALQLVEQLAGEEIITQVHCREGLGRLIQSYSSLEAAAGGLEDLAVWSLDTEKVKLADLAEMTEGGSTHPLLFAVLQSLAGRSEDTTLQLFKDSGVKLLEQLPPELRTEEQLGQQLEDRKLSFLLPLLTIKGELWRQLETSVDPDSFLAWIRSNVSLDHQADPAFVYALVGTLLRHVTERAAAGDQGREPAEVEKELILQYKGVLQTFLKRDSALHLCAIYALQVFCCAAGFPKGLLLRWFMALYEADMVEEHAFLQWKEDVNDTYPGKGKALFQVNMYR